jgi:3-demethoxyubiquinol 3-hydroxylase
MVDHGKLNLMDERRFSFLDQLVGQVDQALRILAGPAPRVQRASPAIEKNQVDLSAQERALAGRLMRVNHAGEIAAQALYQGQALAAKLPAIRVSMEQAAREETDHLGWTQQRVHELGTHTSYLNPVWYTGSFLIGALNGLMGDKWSLGFVAETERQVVEHLHEHLARLPQADSQSRAILQQMQADEAQHATVALASGAEELPRPIKLGMRAISKVMTRIAFWI